MVGLLGILEEIHYLCTKWNITNGSCAISCDGLSALKQVQHSNRHSLHSRQTSSDIISACIGFKETIPITLTYTHVKGHQDSLHFLDKLSVTAQLNILMDALAKDLAMDTNEEDTHHLPEHTHSFGSPTFQGIKVHENIQKNLYNLITHDKAIKYWVDKGRIKQNHVNKIDWKAQEMALKTIKGSRRRTITKWTSGWLGTGKNMKRWGLRYEGYCPFCSFPDESTLHILTCKHNTQQQLWNRLLTEYEVKLKKLDTNYYLQRSIIREIKAWRKGDLLPHLNYADTELTQIILLQRDIGWKEFLEGLVSTSMIKYQRQHYINIDSKRHINTWIKKVIRGGWHLILQVWSSRNEFLQKAEQLGNLEGVPILDKTIEKEWEYGLGKLPILEFSPFFRIKKDRLIAKSTESKKDWLATVKTARNLYQDTTTPDEFDTNITLRVWIGMDDN